MSPRVEHVPADRLQWASDRVYPCPFCAVAIFTLADGQDATPKIYCLGPEGHVLEWT